MSTPIDALALNRDLWDKRMRAHLDARLYPSQAVEDGTYEVARPELAEIGDVRGRRLLHLQCNGGADSLFWARHGATVVGVDFSAEAIAEARRLTSSTELPATFVESDIYALDSFQLGHFDIVYTSTGVLWWLPDLHAWARVIANHLAPGAFFYINEIHPFSMTLREGGDGLVVGLEYFGSREPLVYKSSGTYYDAGPDFVAETATECGWVHSLGEVVTALIEAGLRIEFLHEHDFAHFRMLPSFVQDDDGLWRPPPGTPRLPLTFSLGARL